MADAVLVSGNENFAGGAVAYPGYLGPLINNDFHRVYTDDSFWRWVEVKENDILLHVSGAQDPRDLRGVVFVRRDAIVAWCKAGRAYGFEDVDGMDMDDPAAGPIKKGGP